MGLFEDLLGGSEYKEPALSSQSRKRLQELGMAEEDQPVLQVAPADVLQQRAYGQAGEYLGSELPGAYATTRDLLTNYATQPVDVMSVPGFKGVYDKILSEGSKSSRNLQRALKMTGNAATNSSRGRNAVGQLDTQVQEQLMGAALPLFQEAENRRYDATMALPAIAGQEEAARLRRIAVGEQSGALMRAIQEAINAAEYQAKVNDLNFRYGRQANLLQSTLTEPRLVRKPGILENISGTLKGISDIGGQVVGMTQGIGGFMPSFDGGSSGYPYPSYLSNGMGSNSTPLMQVQNAGLGYNGSMF